MKATALGGLQDGRVDDIFRAPASPPLLSSVRGEGLSSPSSTRPGAVGAESEAKPKTASNGSSRWKGRVEEAAPGVVLFALAATVIMITAGIVFVLFDSGSKFYRGFGCGVDAYKPPQDWHEDLKAGKFKAAGAKNTSSEPSGPPGAGAQLSAAALKNAKKRAAKKRATAAAAQLDKTL